MGTINREIEIIKQMEEKGISLFTLADFAALFSIENKNTLYKRIERLSRKGIIKKIIKGKYLFFLKKPSEFTLANFLYQPSYITLESALSFYGIMTGFPYQITSAATRKTKTYNFEGKEYQYYQLKKELFWGYEKKENFLLAEPEKAMVDFLYFAFKGLRRWDKDEFDLSSLNRQKLIYYFKMIQIPSFLRFLRRIKI